MLVLLAAVATGAWADQLASSYSSNATLNAVTVSASMEVTIATGVTVTINNGLNITSGTLTVKGPGTLVVNGKAGSNGYNGGPNAGGAGGTGSAAITGNIIVQGGATVKATGGNGGNGGTGGAANGGNGANGAAAISGNIIVQGGATVKATGGNGGNGGTGGAANGGNGANGAAAISGNIIVQGGATVKATGGNGGNGGNGDDVVGGNGGNGGVAFAGTLNYKGGTVTADGGNGGSGGSGSFTGGSGGSAGKAFTTSVNFVSSDYILTDGSNAITATQVTSKKKVVISPKVAVNSVTLAPTSATLTLGETETVTLIPTVLPDDATDKTVTWTTSNASVATVADGVVTAVAPGTATITATATNGTADTSDDKTATCEVTVSPAGYSVSLKSGTEDATSWQGKAGEGEYQELPLTGLEAGTAVSVKYNGTKKVKSVKAVKKAAAKPALSLTSPSVGQVIGSDGKNYAAASVPSGVTKVAMIAYVSGSNGLAIALDDEGKLNWATAKSTCEAKTPAFTNGTWHLPSQAEWNNMFSANGGDEESYYGLNAAINTAGGTTLQSGFYWSSSEYSPGVGAHLVHLDDGDADWSKANETLVRKVRACLAF